MAVSAQPKSFADVDLTFLDGAGSPTTLNLYGTLDNLSLSNLKNPLNTVTDHQSRGNLTGSTYGARELITGSFGFQVMELSDASPGAIPDWVLRTGGYSSLVSTKGTGTRIVWKFDMKIKINGAAEYGDSDDHIFYLRNVKPLGLQFSVGDPVTFTLNFDAEDSDGDITCLELAA